MKSFFVFVCLTFFALPLFSQQSNIDLCAVLQHALKNNSTDTLNSLLLLDSTLVNPYEKAELYSMRAKLKLYHGQKELGKKETLDPTILRNVQEDFTRSIAHNQDEKDKLKYIFRRYITLEEFEPHYSEFQSDLNLLSENGYRKDKFGLGLTATLKYDNEIWLGVEFPLFSGYGPAYHLKDGYKQTIHQRKYSKSASALVFGYSRNLESNMSDFSFSLLRLESPLFVDVIQFGVINALDSNHWYYRPEIGIGYSIFHISVGYTVFFKSQKSSPLANTIFGFRAKHTF